MDDYFLPTILKNLALITTVFVIVLIYWGVWLVRARGRKIIRINKITISKDLLERGLTENILLRRLKNSLYDSVHNFYKKEKSDALYYLHMPFEQLFGFDTDKAIVEISNSSEFWRPILVIFNKIIYRIFSVSFEISFQRLADSKTSHSYKVYHKAELIKKGKFDIEKESETSFNDIISEISSSLIAQVCPPCYLKGIELLKKNIEERDQSLIAEIDTLIAQVTNKLILGSKNYCCNECKEKINSSKFLKECNRLHGFMMTPIGVKFLYLIDVLDRKKEYLDEDDMFYKQLKYMETAFDAYKKNKSIFFKKIYRGRIKNRHRWLNFFEGRMKHTWFENMFYKEVLKLQNKLTRLNRKKSYVRLASITENKFKDNLESYKKGLTKTFFYGKKDENHKNIRKEITLFSRDKKHKAYFIHNIADLYFRKGNIRNHEDCILKNILLANKFNPMLMDGLVDYCYFSFRLTLWAMDKGNKQNNIFSKQYPYGKEFHNDGLQMLQKYLCKKNITRSIEGQILLYAIQIGCVLRYGKESPNILNNQSDLNINTLLICIDNLNVLADKLKQSDNFIIQTEVYHLLWLAMCMKLIFEICKEEVQNKKKEKIQDEEMVQCCMEKMTDMCNKIDNDEIKQWYKSVIFNNDAIFHWHYYRVRLSNYNDEHVRLIKNSCSHIQINPYINENAKRMEVDTESSLKFISDSHIQYQKDLFNKFRTQSYIPILRIEKYKKNHAISRKFDDGKQESYCVSEVYI